jgi:hypothetical protein
MTTLICATCGTSRPSYEGAITATLDPSLVMGACTSRTCKGRTRALKVFRPDTRDPVESHQRRTEGEDRANGAAQHHDPRWSEAFDRELRALAASGLHFTSEDVLARVGVSEIASPQAVGAKFSAAAKRHLIEWTGQVTNSARPESHAAMLKVWRGR